MKYERETCNLYCEDWVSTIPTRVLGILPTGWAVSCVTRNYSPTYQRGCM